MFSFGGLDGNVLQRKCAHGPSEHIRFLVNKLFVYGIYQWNLSFRVKPTFRFYCLLNAFGPPLTFPEQTLLIFSESKVGFSIFLPFFNEIERDTRNPGKAMVSLIRWSHCMEPDRAR